MRARPARQTVGVEGAGYKWVSANLYALEVAPHQIVALRQINHVMRRLEFAGRGDVQLIFAGVQICDLVVAAVSGGGVPFSAATVIRRRGMYFYAPKARACQISYFTSDCCCHVRSPLLCIGLHEIGAHISACAGISHKESIGQGHLSQTEISSCAGIFAA